MRRALHVFLLVFTFLFAQTGMGAHAASHVAQSTHDGGKGLPSETVCELCAAYAQLDAGALLSQVPSLPVCVAGDERPVSFAAFSVCRAVFHSLARAPPVFS